MYFPKLVGIEIGQLCSEIQLLSHHKTSKIRDFSEKSKKFKFKFFYIF
jgi:hypothetical protein